MKWLLAFFRWLFGSKPSVPATPSSSSSSESSVPQGGSTMISNRYALLVGINKYVGLQGADLNGCVNDVNDVYDRLTKNFEFPEDNIRVLCDERATQQNILERLEWLVSSAKPGDLLFFQYSGHGSSLRCRVEGKLEPEECQILCPTDMDWDNPLTDKMLAAFFRRIPVGAFLTFMCDACHSGTMDRLMMSNNPHPRKVRYLAPPFDIAVRARNRSLPVNHIGWKDLFGPKDGNVAFFEKNRHMLLSGCRDTQTSADAFIEGQYNGAMTAAWKKSVDANLSTDWLSAHSNMLRWLSENQYDQVPQLSGPERVLKMPVLRGL